MNNEYVIRCHNTKAYIYDIFDLNKFKQGYEYLDCIEEATDYEAYDDYDIGELSSKMIKNIDRIINEIENKNFEKAILLEDFCLVIEEC